jgi:hypothetical protein
MKKLVIMAALAVAAVSASAVELGARGTFSSADNMADAVGVTVGQKFGKFGVEGAFDRTTRGATNVNKWSAVASFDVVKLGPTMLVAKAGAYTVDPSVGANGGGALVGADVVYPLNKQVSLVGGYQYQSGASRVSFADGNYFTVGAKYSF